MEILDLKESIEEDEVIIQYGQTLDSVLAITLDNQEIQTFVIDSKANLDSLVKIYVETISNPFSNNYADLSVTLYDKLIGNLKLSGRKITIIPDGTLNYLPFGSLLTDASNTSSFLESDLTISYQLSLKLLKNLSGKNVKSRGLGAFAPNFDENPDRLYATVRGSIGDSISLYHLPFAQKEVKKICDSWDAEIPITTKETIINSLSENRIFHFSGHAISYADNPDDSFLALGSDIEMKDQKLLLKELYDIECNNEMVVLSACETGTGALVKGEGALSLARGFIYAGAKSVISTLWPANDQSSAIIMNSFYEELKKGHPKDVALRKAKLDYIEKADPRYRHPYFWSAFTPVGDMSPLLDPYSRWKLWIISILVIAILFIGLRLSARGRSEI